MNNRRIEGVKGETVVCDYLLKKGFYIVKRNYYSRYGEIDIISEDNKYIVFVEVKTRRKNAMISGVEAVNWNKRMKVIKTAFIYVLNNPTEKQMRFDIVEVTKDIKGNFIVTNYIENAFNAEEYDAFF